jgi:Bacterial regulatory protein, Fis family
MLSIHIPRPFSEPTVRAHTPDQTILTRFLCVDRITRSMALRAQQSYDDHRTLLWIEGEAGVGKSLLMDCIIERDAQKHTYVPADTWKRIALAEDASDATLEHMQHLWATSTRCMVQIEAGLSSVTFDRYAAFLCAHHAKSPALILIESRTLQEQAHALREPLYALKHQLLHHPHQHIVLAPLHYRPHDTAYYLMHYLECCADMMRLPHTPYLSASVMEWLQKQRWNDNIRSIQTLCFMLCQQRHLEVQHPDHIAALTRHVIQSSDALASHTPANPSLWVISLMDETTGKIRPLHSIEQEIIARFYHHHQGCKSNTSRDLGIGRTTLYRKLKEHGIVE